MGKGVFIISINKVCLGWRNKDDLMENYGSLNSKQF